MIPLTDELAVEIDQTERYPLGLPMCNCAVQLKAAIFFDEFKTEKSLLLFAAVTKNISITCASPFSVTDVNGRAK